MEIPDGRRKLLNYIKSKCITEFRIKAALLQLFLTNCRHKPLPL